MALSEPPRLMPSPPGERVQIHDQKTEVSLDARQTTLVDVGTELRRAGYRFATPTPETHRRVMDRDPGRAARDARDVFGWSRPFEGAVVAPLLSPALFERCVTAEIFVTDAPPATAGHWKSRVRFSTLAGPTGELLLVHSAYPTAADRSVFFGPDSYRFAALLERTVARARRVVDVGCGTGVGGLALAGRVDELVLADVNPDALALAAVNAALAGVAPGTISFLVSDVLAQVDDGFDLVVANPPYLVDDAGRLYRDGGGSHGIDLAVRIVEQSLARLPHGGQLILYTGTPIEDGRNVLAECLRPLAATRPATWCWEELDPDVFGEELERPAYRDAERLAVVALHLTVA